jgi:hypothetical protein
MEKRVREKTWPVLGNRLASTVLAIKAAFVLRLAGMFLLPLPTELVETAGLP